ncbi:hypothetical protein I7I53_01340 [Histoplasma capsulatum var. duboisii H88]|uniref:Secreted protein n=1 Tax=Ajellomyces capsulatus (strain H88) TaxID=544711 RepID=A0A8A1LHS3_AJEC8|nr:hypothetical protein I7I53_01340 [Histoplasma capsulatum var. duboisii H88]
MISLASFFAPCMMMVWVLAATLARCAEYRSVRESNISRTAVHTPISAYYYRLPPCRDNLKLPRPTHANVKNETFISIFLKSCVLKG